MKILIVGAGQVGSQICRYLVREMDCEITVLDNNSDNVGLITDKLNIIGVVGEGTRGEDLKRSGINNTDLIVAVTPSDETNVLSTFFARKLNPDIQTIARIRNTDYHEFVSEKSDGFIDIIINPEGAVADAAQRLLRSKQLFFYQNLFNGKAQVIGLNLNEKSSVLNTSLRQLSETFEGLRTFVVGYRRNNVLHLANPDDQLIEGDKVYLIAASDDLERTLEIFGVEKPPFHRVIVIGGGKIGLDFTKRVEKNFSNYQLKLIEMDKVRAETIAGELTRAIVLQGDGMEEDLLNEAGIHTANTIISFTENDKSNLLMLYKAKELNPNITTIGLIKDYGLSKLGESMGIDIVLNPQTTTVSSIIPNVKPSSFKQVQMIGEDEGEVCEVLIERSHEIESKQLGEIKIPVKFGAILRDDEPIGFNTQTRIQAGDQVALFMLSKDIRKVTKYFSVDAY